MDKFEFLEAFCASKIKRPEASVPIVISWDDQSRQLWSEAQYFAPWQDVSYEPSAEALADEAIVNRTRLGRWKRVSPAAGRVLGSRLAQALTVIRVNAMNSDRAGTTLPSGLGTRALTSALLIYWCYAMELPWAESGGSVAGRA